MNFSNTLEFAKSLDAKDTLAKYKSEFIFPKVNGKDVIYFTGNSLGLQPKKAKEYVDEIMTNWAELAVEGHFNGSKPWWDYHERLAEPMAKLLGAAHTNEVAVMNALSVNLNLLLVSFYRPTKTRYKILCEDKAFPSDQYLLQSQVRHHGYTPEDAIVEFSCRPGEDTFRTEDIIAKINELGDELAVVLIGGVNYYTGQVLDMKAITKAGQNVGAYVGWDLAHAAGNVKMDLHNWNVDFAAWCSYKYLNSGPGSPAGIFVHSNHHNSNLPRFAGWIGHNKERRFLMEPVFDPMEGADGWHISNSAILSLAPYLASVEMFDEVGLDLLIEKRNNITAYLQFIIEDIAKATNSEIRIITPMEQEARGSQLSVCLQGKGKDLFYFLLKQGVISDWREPNVIRLAPVPFYTSYEDMYNFGQILKQGLQ